MEGQRCLVDGGGKKLATGDDNPRQIELYTEVILAHSLNITHINWPRNVLQSPTRLWIRTAEKVVGFLYIRLQELQSYQSHIICLDLLKVNAMIQMENYLAY